MKGSARRFQILVGVLMAAVSVFVNAPQLVAQTVNGNIVGTVRDQQGAVVPNASVSAKNLGTGAERAVVSDAAGGFSVVSVPAGSYDVTATAPGFQTEVRSGVTLTVGAAVRVDFTLNVGAVAERVEVTGEAPQVDTTTSTISGLVGDTAIRELPLNGRDWLQLAVLQPGALAIETQKSTTVVQGDGMMMSISGGRPTQNVFRVDGLVVNDQTNRSPGSALGVNLGVDAIREFSILTNTFSAEYGRSTGGVINAITKSGTNTLHGTAFYFGRNSALDARNFFDLQIPPFRRHQFGGSAGGPIKKNKLFFFGNYEGLRQFLSLSFSSNTLSPNARNGILTTGPVTIDPRMKPYLALFPLPNGPITGNSGKFVFGGGQKGVEDFATGKIDYLLNPNTTLSGSYSFDNANAPTPDPFNEHLIAIQTRNQRVTLSLQHVFTASVLNTVRGGFSRTAGSGNLDTQPATPLLTDLALGFIPGKNVGTFLVPGLDSFGGIGSTGSDIIHYTAPQMSDDLSWVKGRNSIRVGFSVEAIRNNITGLSNPAGRWQFGSIQDMLLVIPQTFNSDFPGTDSYRGVRVKLFGFYFQDDLRLRPNLTLNLGVRYEPATTINEVNGKAAKLLLLTDAQPVIGNPVYENPTRRNFAPRVGLAWDPTGSGKTAIRSGFGIYDVAPTPNVLNNPINRSVPFFQAGTLLNAPSSSFPNRVFSLLGPTSLTSALVEQNPRLSYKLQWNFNIQRQVTRDLSIMMGYVGSRGIHLPLNQTDTNQVPPPLTTVAPDGHLLFPTTGPIQRINPNFAKIYGTGWYGYSTYHSLQVNVIKRLSHGLALQGVYSWSKSIDIGASEHTSGEFLNSMELPWAFNPNLNRGVTDFDIPHHLSLNFLWDVPSPHSGMVVSRFLLSGWELGGIFTAQSGGPFSARITVDRARTGASSINSSNGGQRPDYNPAPGCSLNAVNPGDPTNYVKLQCFSFPALGELGNLGRNTMRGPGLEDFDFSLFKNQNLLRDKLKVQFRAEVFNLLNRANFNAQLITALNAQGQPVPINAALRPPTATKSRQIQFGMKLVW